jgi:hypothetical protein
LGACGALAHLPNLAGRELSDPNMAVRRNDNSRRVTGNGGCIDQTRHAAGADDPDPARVVHCKPELVVIGGGDDKGIRRLTQVIEEKGGKLVNAAAGGDRRDLVAGFFGEPEIAVGTEDDPGRHAAGRRHGIFREGLRAGNPRPAHDPAHDADQSQPKHGSRGVMSRHLMIPPFHRDDSVPGSLFD